MTLSVATERLRTFSDALTQRYGHFSLEPIRDPKTASGSFRNRALDTITLGLIDVERLVSRRPKLADHLQDLTFMLAPMTGELVVDQYDRTSRLVPGDVLILDSMAGCTIAVENQCSTLLVELNRSAFSRFGDISRQLCARRLEARKYAGGLFSNVVGTIANNLDGCEPRDGELICDLLVAFLSRLARDGAPDQQTHRSVMIISQMREWVRSNVGDPDLSPDKLAEHFGYSRRGVYRHFAAVGTTPARWLWDVRLECAEERLKQMRGSVSEVAYSVGFNDSGHFARLYKRRYGRSPRRN